MNLGCVTFINATFDGGCAIYPKMRNELKVLLKQRRQVMKKPRTGPNAFFEALEDASNLSEIPTPVIRNYPWSWHDYDVEGQSHLCIAVTENQDFKLEYVTLFKGKSEYIRLLFYDPVEEIYCAMDPSKIGKLFVKDSTMPRCKKCKKTYIIGSSHQCRCIACGYFDCLGSGKSDFAFGAVTCQICNIKLFDHHCKKNHDKKCNKNKKRCLECDFIVYKKDSNDLEHECFKSKCVSCDSWVGVSAKHRCYVPVIPEDDLVISEDYYFYDIECCMDEYHKYGDKWTKHVLAMINVVDFSGARVGCYETFTDFFNFVTSLKPGAPKGKITFIAHNSAKYDNTYMLKGLQELDIQYSTVRSIGNTYMYITIQEGKIRFIDSFLLFPSSLAGLAKAFGLELSKGYFPYNFFTVERKRYVGHIPIDEFKDKDEPEFLKWYEDNQIIDLFELCKEYCYNDCQMLAGAMKKYRQFYLDKTDGKFDPLAMCFTAAQVSMKIDQCMFLKAGTRPRLTHDFDICHKSISWLYSQLGDQFKEAELDVQISDDLTLNALHNRVAYIFVKCFDVGCKSRYPHAFSTHPVIGCKTSYVKTRFRMLLKNLDDHLNEVYDKYILMKECDWKGELIDPLPILKIRQALKGGRTECFVSYMPDCHASYLDVNSMYPAVQSGRFNSLVNGYPGRLLKFPTDHGRHVIGITPEILHRMYEYEEYPFENPASEAFFGLLWLRVFSDPEKRMKGLPPLLPHRILINGNEKLVFGDGLVEGVWTSAEVCLAVRMGYVITEVIDAFESKEKSSKHFRDFILSMYKDKVHASGWPAGVETDEQKQRYMNLCKSRIGIELDPEKMVVSKPARAAAKVTANSHWGKLGQRKMTSKTFVIDWDELLKLKDDYTKESEIRRAWVGDDKKMKYEVQVDELDDTVPPAKTSNCLQACFVTSYARIRLYECMWHVARQGGTIIYCDTDSIIFDGPVPDFIMDGMLGQLSSELEEGEYINHFMSLGAKAYRYETNKEHVKQCSKGITFTKSTIPRDVYKNMVLRGETIQVDQLRIKNYNGTMGTVLGFKKVLKATNDKREFYEDEIGNMVSRPLFNDEEES